MKKKGIPLNILIPPDHRTLPPPPPPPQKKNSSPYPRTFSFLVNDETFVIFLIQGLSKNRFVYMCVCVCMLRLACKHEISRTIHRIHVI